ncbi:MAG: kynureninase [Actinoallomurus sp.]
MTDLSREGAVALDAADPIASLRDAFVRDEPGLIYLDGNSLGRLPKVTAERVARAVRDEWGRGLIRSWRRWVDLPFQVGDLIGSSLVGAAPGQVVVSDSTTVNLYKLAVAALDARPGRTVIVADDDNFPTDRYVLEGLAAQRGIELRIVHADIDDGLDLDVLREAVGDDTALVSLSHVAYRSGALLEMAAVNEIVHGAGALMLWDLSHSAGSVPVDLDASGSDLAVGCTYKYLNGGPGAPGFLYVRQNLQDQLRQPIWGWFGQRDQFAMGPSYEPAPGIDHFLVGTPAVVGTMAVEEGVRLLAEAGIERLRAKGLALTAYVIELVEAWLPGLDLATPADPRKRGSHVSLRHPEAWRFTQALIEEQVIPDYRTPDRLRLGPAPISTSFADVWDALDRLRRIVDDKTYERFSADPGRVT